MPLVYSDKGPIFFAHVPKTGGTSIKDYLVNRFGSLSIVDRGDKRDRLGSGLIIPPSHLSARDLAELLPHNLLWSFAIVRDPLTRLQSEYRFQKNISYLSRMSFSTWVETALRAAKMEPRLYDNHIRPQVDLIPEEAEIFCLEDGLDPLIQRLDHMTGTSRPDLSIPRMNVRPKAGIDLTRRDVEKIVAFYAADYERLGYAPPDPSDWPDGPGPNRMVVGALARLLVAKQRRDWVR